MVKYTSPISDSMPDKIQRERLLPFVGKYVRATGHVFERGGSRAIALETITDLKNVPLVTAAVRDFIARGGYGEYFIHRTGHSIGSSIHANGANLDDLEIGDEREIIPNTCFSVEPGIYMPDFGVRSEVNVLVRERSAEVTGRIQTELVII
jgi:Xaa-Pro aminopeptidase